MKNIEHGDNYDDEFDDIRVRHAFVRKVVGIVAVQLLITTAIVIPFVYVEEVKTFSLTPGNRWVMWLCMGLTMVCGLAIGCCEKARRKFPINFILLFIFTLAEGVLVGFICGAKYPMHVLIAFGITVGLCTILILFATQVKFDFTGFGPYLLIVVIIILILSIVAIFWRNRILMIVISSAGVLVFSIYLVIDIQMMLGGRHKYQFSSEDYIMAALSIYTDIITIFLYILSLLGLTMDD